MGLWVPAVLPKTCGFAVQVWVLWVWVRVGLRRPVPYPCATLTITTTPWTIPSTSFTQHFYPWALWDWPQYLPCISKVPWLTNSHSWRTLLVGGHLWCALTTYNLSSASLQPSSLLISCRCPFPIMSQNQMDHLTLILFLLHLLPLWWLGYLHSQT